ncbi:hypothetical protein UVI_02037840 [Ustilaginoidea virens]|uniref:Smr domain-containing protein n=1 Tax=Ustilaginoidea virens TaxID=1159556 RepID=A0A1B5KT62_USTVR|nr:hypothetical protein UVI_02037840 [Ustilaginoidea virens]
MGRSHRASIRHEDYNRQAVAYIFRENNAPGKVGEDTIDLHGLFVDEAARVLEERIRADQQRGQEHLHAIVGKGKHSAGHMQKLKPKVEALCRELGLKYGTEENAGRMYINLQGRQPASAAHHGGGQQQHGPQHHGGQHSGQQQQGQQQGQEGLVGKVLPKIVQKLEKACCAVM